MMEYDDIEHLMDAAFADSKEAYRELVHYFAYDFGKIEKFAARSRDSLMERARNGNARAQSFVCALYLYGWGGVTQDNEQALKFARLSAGLGEPIGEVMLGIMYLYGSGVVKDPTRARYWLQMAVDKGNTVAFNHIGLIVEEGQGTKANLKEAFNYYRKSAEAKDPLGIYNLGRCYEKGIAVALNIPEAIRLYDIAARHIPIAVEALDRIKKTQKL